MSVRALAPFATALLVAILPSQDEPASRPASASGPSLHWQSGKVVVGNNLATIALPEGLRYLQSKDARYVVEKLWHNPPDPKILGLVAPAEDASTQSDDSWAIIVSYEEDGHVKDEDASSLNYDELLASMKKDALEANPQRKREGYPTVELLGWAEAPHYDAVEKKLYWAKNARFSDSTDVQLNYDVRVLTRRGVLVMEALGKSSQLTDIAKASKQVLAATTVNAGNRYDEFDSGLDKVAAYGIGGLIAGKLLLKAGFFKLMLKPLLVVGALLVGLVAKLFGKKKAAAADGNAG